MKKVRDSNFEFMRIVSMFFIVLWHTIIHSKLMYSTENAITVYLDFILIICEVHVNSFLILSGYYQSKSKFKLSKVLSLIFEVIFYISILTILGIKIGIVKQCNYPFLIGLFLPSAIVNYWFVASYIVIYIFSDYINKFINCLSREEYKKVLILFFVITSVFDYLSGGNVMRNPGYSISHFLFLYLIGGYLRRYPLKDSYHFKRLSLNGYKYLMILCFILLSIIKFTLNGYIYAISGYSNFFRELSKIVLYFKYGYSAPITILQTVCYFEFFKSLKIRSRFLNYISSCTLAIYLLHDNVVANPYIYKLFKVSDPPIDYGKILYIFSFAYIVFMVGVVVESMRKFLIFIINKTKIKKKMGNKFQNFINSFNVKINY